MFAFITYSASAFVMSWWSEDLYDQPNEWYLAVYGIIGLAACLVLKISGVAGKYSY